MWDVNQHRSSLQMTNLDLKSHRSWHILRSSLLPRSQCTSMSDWTSRQTSQEPCLLAKNTKRTPKQLGISVRSTLSCACGIVCNAMMDAFRAATTTSQSQVSKLKGTRDLARFKINSSRKIKKGAHSAHLKETQDRNTVLVLFRQRTKKH